MSKEIIVENIYFALYKYDSEQNVLNKAMYLSTAATLLKALIQREGLDHPIELARYDPEEEETKREEYDTKAIITLLDRMIQEIARVSGLANKQEAARGALLDGEFAYWVVDLLGVMSEALRKLEAIKQTVLEVLVLAGYDDVKLTQIDELIKTKTTRNAELARL